MHQPIDTQATQDNKTVVQRLIEDVITKGRLDLIDELYAPQMADAARRWIEPFRAAFPDVHMEIVELVAEADKVVGRFRCSGTHRGTWRGHPPTGRRFERVDEVYFFDIHGGKVTSAWGLEDTRSRLKQLGLRTNP
jgi:predicted ester cyclase